MIVYATDHGKTRFGFRALARGRFRFTGFGLSHPLPVSLRPLGLFALACVPWG